MLQASCSLPEDNKETKKVTQEISLQKMIDQVKKELLAPSASPDYPLLVIDEVELELAVAITQEAGGEIGISVLETLSGKVQGDLSRQHSHTVRLTLTPVLSREEIKALLDRDDRLRKRINEIGPVVLTRSEDLEGEPE
jgi:hypothetical protein